MCKKFFGLALGCFMLVIPCTAFARGDYDYDAVQERYVESARGAVDTSTRPEHPLLNAATDNEAVRSNEFTRFVETDERHFVTITCEEDGKAVFGHEEMCGIEAGKTYDVEIYIRNDATLCLEHSPMECDKTLRDVKVKAAYPDDLTPNQNGCVVVEISSTNGTTESAIDFAELVGAGDDTVHLSLETSSLLIKSDGLTDGMELDRDTFFGEGAEVGYFSLNSGIPAGYSMKVKFTIRT